MPQDPKSITRVKNAALSFQVFFTLRHHKQRYHIAETTSGGEKADMRSLADTGDDKRLEEELQSCRHYLDYSKKQKRRLCVFNFFVNNLTAQVI